MEQVLHLSTYVKSVSECICSGHHPRLNNNEIIWSLKNLIHFIKACKLLCAESFQKIKSINMLPLVSEVAYRKLAKSQFHFQLFFTGTATANCLYLGSVPGKQTKPAPSKSQASLGAGSAYSGSTDCPKCRAKCRSRTKGPTASFLLLLCILIRCITTGPNGDRVWGGMKPSISFP